MIAPDGVEWEEIIPIEGGYHFPCYSTVEEAVRLCERHEVSRDSWPIYYDGPWPIPLDEVSRKCLLLRESLSRIDHPTIGDNWFLECVWECLSSGEVFYVGP